MDVTVQYQGNSFIVGLLGQNCSDRVSEEEEKKEERSDGS
jgi:hypothetical protein